MKDLRGSKGIELIIRVIALKAGHVGETLEVLVDEPSLPGLLDGLAKEGVACKARSTAEGTVVSLGSTPTAAEPLASFISGTIQIGPEGASLVLPTTEQRPVGAPSACGASRVTVAAAQQGGMVVFVASDLFGDGDRKLGEILMRSATKVVSGFSPLPKCMIFMNAGVRLTTAESNLLDDLRHMETQGVELLSCGTCLDFYGLKEQLKVGRISNMAEILGTLASATQVLRL